MLNFAPAPPSLGELFLLAILAIAVGGLLWLAYRALKKFWDREIQDRRLQATRFSRCVQCDYPIRDTIRAGHIRCPECGKVIERAQRRRFRTATDVNADADVET